MPLAAAAKKYVFTPLGLKRTGYLPTGEDIAFTEADPLTGEPRIGMPDEENTRFFHGVSGSAGVFSGAEDCCRFLAMLAGGGVLEGRMLLTPEAVRLFTADHTKNMKEAWGLGFQLAGRDVTFMGDLWPKNSFGLMGATGTAMAVDPQRGLYVALLSNRVQMAHENRAFLRLMRLVFTSAYADALRSEE
jgi:CubicO group peptidase (beta-lactamase class C family)